MLSWRGRPKGVDVPVSTGLLAGQIQEPAHARGDQNCGSGVPTNHLKDVPSYAPIAVITQDFVREPGFRDLLL